MGQGDVLTAGASEPLGTLETALAHAVRLSSANPLLAAAQAREILKVAPGHPEALRLLGAALRGQGDLGAAREVLEPLAAAHPRFAAAHLEVGLVHAAAGRRRAAFDATARATALAPLHDAWRRLGDQLALAGDHAGADEAYARHVNAQVKDPRLLEAAAALNDGRLAAAERMLRDHLKASPTDVAAIRMLAEIGTRLGRYEDAENLLARCLELAPSFAPARRNYAVALYRQTKAEAALVQIDMLLADDPRDPGLRNLKAAALGRVGDYEQAIACYEALLRDHPVQPKAWMSLGHALKTVGRRADSVAAYRKAQEQAPALGEAYWSLANLKTFRFDQADVAAMRAQLGRPDLADEDRLHLRFALGKALEDAGADEEAFQQYLAGNALRRASLEYDPDETAGHVRRCRATFTAGFFAAREGGGCQAPDPIFIVGLPRAGSTLVEQILSSHSQVEGTMELPDIPALARRLDGRSRRDEASSYVEAVAALDGEALREMGEAYLESTRVQRRLGRPFFIDKMPNNFAHVGLIRLILPRARIIDVRRHPLGCGFSGFKQHFARGQAFTYDLTDLGRYYADYVALMAHFDAVLPGCVHRVIYEALVDDLEGEVRRLLDYCGLPFEPACLAFHDNDRAVRTASSEQVRRPLFAEGVDHWRRFEPWLGPLKAALGPVLEAYPAAPGED